MAKSSDTGDNCREKLSSSSSSSSSSSPSCSSSSAVAEATAATASSAPTLNASPMCILPLSVSAPTVTPPTTTCGPPLSTSTSAPSSITVSAGAKSVGPRATCVAGVTKAKSRMSSRRSERANKRHDTKNGGPRITIECKTPNQVKNTTRLNNKQQTSLLQSATRLLNHQSSSELSTPLSNSSTPLSYHDLPNLSASNFNEPLVGQVDKRPSGQSANQQKQILSSSNKNLNLRTMANNTSNEQLTTDVDEIKDDNGTSNLYVTQPVDQQAAINYQVDQRPRRGRRASQDPTGNHKKKANNQESKWSRYYLCSPLSSSSSSLSSQRQHQASCEPIIKRRNSEQHNDSNSSNNTTASYQSESSQCIVNQNLNNSPGPSNVGSQSMHSSVDTCARTLGSFDDSHMSSSFSSSDGDAQLATAAAADIQYDNQLKCESIDNKQRDARSHSNASGQFGSDYGSYRVDNNNCAIEQPEQQHAQNHEQISAEQYENNYYDSNGATANAVYANTQSATRGSTTTTNLDALYYLSRNSTSSYADDTAGSKLIDNVDRYNNNQQQMDMSQVATSDNIYGSQSRPYFQYLPPSATAPPPPSSASTMPDCAECRECWANQCSGYLNYVHPSQRDYFYLHHQSGGTASMYGVPQQQQQQHMAPNGSTLSHPSQGQAQIMDEQQQQQNYGIAMARQTDQLLLDSSHEHQHQQAEKLDPQYRMASYPNGDASNEWLDNGGHYYGFALHHQQQQQQQQQQLYENSNAQQYGSFNMYHQQQLQLQQQQQHHQVHASSESPDVRYAVSMPRSSEISDSLDNETKKEEAGGELSSLYQVFHSILDSSPLYTELVG